MAAVEQMIARAQQAGNAAAIEHLQSRLDVFRQVQQAMAAANASSAEDEHNRTAFESLLQQYTATWYASDRKHPDAAVWQAITAMGKELLAYEAKGLPNAGSWELLHQQIAGDYNLLGYAHFLQDDLAAALAAFERAVAIEPGNASLRCNVAETLIRLGRLEEAQAVVAEARALDANATGLAEVTALLATALDEG
jgi:Flp pilus assembly protein TadD